MKQLRVGYDPISKDLTHPADRRRVVFWAKDRGHTIVTNLDERHDLVLISERADIGSWSRKKGGPPKIFDLIDGYLEPRSQIDDLIRGVGKVITGQLTGTPKSFKKFTQELCQAADGVICSTPEQKVGIQKLNSNVHPILDSHDEFPILEPQSEIRSVPGARMFWEGLPYTLSGMSVLERAFQGAENEDLPQLSIVTNPTYPKILGKFFVRNTQDYLDKEFPKLASHASVEKWNLESIHEVALKSNLGVIPLDLRSNMNIYKAENRLLIMWRLGLPVLASPTKAYSRVIRSLGTVGLCNTPEDWARELANFKTHREMFWEQVKLGQQYLNQTHSKEILLSSWDRAVESVL
ncbi:MAG: hypothetical protein Q8K86_09910 [Candidatus Nanopelagicaceae bacterium]|nr:hypothetical protein [Candidatus Nanopelagicaceae bacterium]